MTMHSYRSAFLVAICALSINLTGCNDAQSKTAFLSAVMISSVPDDSALASRVRAALMASLDIPDLDIQIQIQKGRVVLSGFASDQTEIDRNLSLVRQVKGVRTIVNHISIRQFT